MAVAILLAEVYGFTLDEAARILEASTLQAKNWVQSGRARLRDKYAALPAPCCLRSAMPGSTAGSASAGHPVLRRARCAEAPFAETKEQLCGYYVIEVRDLDEALTWAARCPAAVRGSVELRLQGYMAN